METGEGKRPLDCVWCGRVGTDGVYAVMGPDGPERWTWRTCRECLIRGKYPANALKAQGALARFIDAPEAHDSPEGEALVLQSVLR